MTFVKACSCSGLFFRARQKEAHNRGGAPTNLLWQPLCFFSLSSPRRRPACEIQARVVKWPPQSLDRSNKTRPARADPLDEATAVACHAASTRGHETSFHLPANCSRDAPRGGLPILTLITAVWWGEGGDGEGWEDDLRHPWFLPFAFLRLAGLTAPPFFTLGCLHRVTALQISL